MSFTYVIAHAEMTGVDPFKQSLLKQCERNGWRGLSSTLTLAKFYPEDSLRQCDPKQRISPKIGSILSAKYWLLYHKALLGRDLDRLQKLQVLINPLLKPKVKIYSRTNPQQKRSTNGIHQNYELPFGLINADFISAHESVDFSWKLNRSGKQRVLSIGYRGQVSVWIDEEQLVNLPSKTSIWIDEVLVEIPPLPVSKELIIKARANSQFIARLGGWRNQNESLWEKSIRRLDQKPSKTSLYELTALAMMAEHIELAESTKILPIIEADQRWSKAPSLWLNQIFLGLSPPEIRAQAWGDYPTEIGLQNESKALKTRSGHILQTHYQLLCLEEFYDHLTNARLYEARSILDTLDPLPWLSSHLLKAKMELYRTLNLRFSPFTLFNESIEIGNYDTSIWLELLSLLHMVAPDRRKGLLHSDRMQERIQTLLVHKHLSPATVQLLTVYLLNTKPDKTWKEVFKRVTSGPAGHILWKDLHTLMQDQLDEVREISFLQHAPSKLHLERSKPIRSKPSIYPPLGGPILANLDQYRLEEETTEQSSIETVYHQIHYHLIHDRLTRTERRVLQPHSKLGVQKLMTLSLPHSPNRQSFHIDHVKHLRRQRGTFQSLELPQRSQRSLSDLEARIYYDLVAEDLTFNDLHPGDIIDIQWSISERFADPQMSLPHSDLVTLQDYSFKRCMLITLSDSLRPKLNFSVELKGFKQKAKCIHNHSQDEIIASLGHLPPLELTPNSLKGTSVNPYVHLSNIRSWSTVSKLYSELLRPLLQETRLLKATAKGWTKNIKQWDGTQKDRIRYEKDVLETLFLKITKTIRYVGLEFGRHSYEPAHPEQTLERQLGDCKDRAALMMSLASSLGIKLHFAMVRTRNAGHINPQGVASMSSFDHAMVFSPKLNRYFDPTLPYYDPKYLPNPNHFAQTLLVNGLTDEGVHTSLRRIPPPSHDDIGNRMDIRLQHLANNVQRLEISLELYGDQSAWVRERFDQDSKNQLEDSLKFRFSQRFSLDYQRSLADLKLSDRDPIRLYFTQKIQKNLLLQDVPQFDLSQRLGISTSQVKATIFIPQSLQVRCIFTPINIDHNLYKKVESKLQSLHQDGQTRSVKMMKYPKKVCLEMRLRQDLITPKEYESFNVWINDVETLLNRSLLDILKATQTRF